MKTQGKGSRVSNRLLKVGIGVSLTAVLISLLVGVCDHREGGGMTLTSEPVSMRKRVCVVVSLT